ncbi:MAG: phenylalanine--tRNA ligase subunit alpha [Chloroflexota bacterium]|nr:phenylalanine--tRNA ligase subunit alpha [Chloroflexota bacterium]
MLDKLESVYTDGIAALDAINDGDALRDWELTYLGKKGALTELMRGVGALPKEDRAAFGKRANEVKEALTAAYAARDDIVKAHALALDLVGGEIDVTLPGRTAQKGGLHPSTHTLRRFYAIWSTMGFQVYRSRDVEDDETNFTLLNMPPYHPARDMQDTIYTTTPNVILRTHTSPGQIRAMRELGADGTAPIRVIIPGMCYRFEQITARSEIQFHQVEALCVGRNIKMSDLKGTVAEFARRMYGDSAKVRFRASYFPFTEPSMEVDVECFLCGGEGCRICKYAGWLEIAGSGMVHPTVLQNGGYDPREWSGFAFGMGPERITMLRHGIQDIRYFWGNDLRFLEQF